MRPLEPCGGSTAGQTEILADKIALPAQADQAASDSGASSLQMTPGEAQSRQAVPPKSTAKASSRSRLPKPRLAGALT